MSASSLTQAFNRRLYLSVHCVWQVAAGLTDYQMEGQLNWTAHRSRGYGVGSLHQKAGEPDKFWVQPGHPLAAKKQEKGKGGRFEVRAGGEGNERGRYGGEGYRVYWGTVRKGEGGGGRESCVLCAVRIVPGMKTKGLLSWWEIPTREHPWTIYEGYILPS